MEYPRERLRQQNAGKLREQVMRKRMSSKKLKALLPEIYRAADSGTSYDEIVKQFGLGLSTLHKKLASRRTRKRAAPNTFDARSFAAEIYASNLSRKTKLFVLELAL